jgi:uncharacterized coiled-coil protein SlyX
MPAYHRRVRHWYHSHILRKPNGIPIKRKNKNPAPPPAGIEHRNQSEQSTLSDDVDSDRGGGGERSVAPQIVDGEPSTRLTETGREHEYWNCCLVEGAQRAKNQSARPFPHFSNIDAGELRGREIRQQIELDTACTYYMEGFPDAHGGERGLERNSSNDPANNQENWNDVQIHNRRRSPGFADFDFGFDTQPHLTNHVDGTEQLLPNHVDEASSLPGDIGDTEQLLRNHVGSSSPSDAAGPSAPLPGQAAYLVNEPREQSPSTNVMTWDQVLNLIIGSGYLDPETMEAVVQRINNIKVENLAEGERGVTMRDVRLVPNFSYPITGSVWYDREDPSRRDSHSLTPGPSRSIPSLPSGILARNLPNGVLIPDFMYSDSSHTFPSGLPAEEEYELLRPSHPSPPPSPMSLIVQHERMIAVQAKLVLKLHNDIDILRNRNTDHEDRNIPLLNQRIEDLEEALARQERKLREMKEKITQLQDCIDFATRLLRGCFDREWGVWSWACGLRQRRRRRMSEVGLWQRLFGGRQRRRGAEKLGNNSLSEEPDQGEAPEPHQSQRGDDHIDDPHIQRRPSLDQSQGGQTREQIPRAVAESSFLARDELEELIATLELNMRIMNEDGEDMTKLLEDYYQRSQ